MASYATTRTMIIKAQAELVKVNTALSALGAASVTAESSGTAGPSGDFAERVKALKGTLVAMQVELDNLLGSIQS